MGKNEETDSKHHPFARIGGDGGADKGRRDKTGEDPDPTIVCVIHVVCHFVYE
ncbi:hypothetical protein MTR_2g097790 [Medicago truncatula]|uniref:Uncharacterized protein n=1 Tax=Medicago truncatula TaxID=3880 RepID=G7IRY7_MEDTR|nr:hypothetical protein MTR_2g097790 [Medicago truncatula]